MKKNSNPMDFTIFYCVIFPLLELCEKREMIEFQKCYIWVPKVIILKGGAPRFLHRFIHILKIIFWPEKKHKFFTPNILWKIRCNFPSHLTLICSMLWFWIKQLNCGLGFKKPWTWNWRKNIVVFLKIAELYKKKIWIQFFFSFQTSY